jgi:hypothetical protein
MRSPARWHARSAPLFVSATRQLARQMAHPVALLQEGVGET